MRTLLVLSLATATGCATLASQTVGHVGCRENEIQTANSQYTGPLGSTLTWDATCHGKSYVCARRSIGAGDHSTYEIACSEKLADPAQAAPSPATLAQ